jgi:hypothetical protein
MSTESSAASADLFVRRWRRVRNTFGRRLIRRALRRPGMLRLHYLARMAKICAAASLDTNRLRCSFYLDSVRRALDGSFEANREWALPRKLGVEQNLLVDNRPGYRRDAMKILQSSGELFTVLMKLKCALLNAESAFPRDLPPAGDVGGLSCGMDRWAIALRRRRLGNKRDGNRNEKCEKNAADHS